MSFQASIPHRPRQVGCTFQWRPACLHNLPPRGHQRGNWRKRWMKSVSNVVNTCPRSPFQVLNLHGFFEDFLCPSNDIFVINKDNVGTGAYVSLAVKSRCVPEESNRENCIFGQYAWVKRSFGTGNHNQVTWLPGAFYALVHQRLFPCTSLYISPNPMNVPAWLYKKIQLRPTASHSSSKTKTHLVRWQAIIWTNDGKFTDAYIRHSASMS